MDKEKISKAPSKETQYMIMDIYNKLGIVANKLAEFLRENGFAAQACHPLGGAVSYPPIAIDAGMGWNGRHGMTIIPEFGPRHRLAAVLTNITNLPDPPQENPHRWIAEYCASCGRCVRTCPAKAIYEEAIVHSNGRVTHIDSDKCFPEFTINYGCSVCIKECLFNKSSYSKLKAVIEKKNKRK